MSCTTSALNTLFPFSTTVSETVTNVLCKPGALSGVFSCFSSVSFAQKQAYQQTVCNLVAEFANRTFDEFKDAFCKNASSAVIDTARKIHEKIVSDCTNMALLSGAVAAACLFPSQGKAGSNPAWGLRILGAFSGVVCLTCTYVVLKHGTGI